MSPGQRSRLFREVNDRIYDLLASAEPDLPGEFLCECGRECGHRVVLLPTAFVALRETGRVVRSPDCENRRLRLRPERLGPSRRGLVRERRERSVGLEPEPRLGVEVVEAGRIDREL